MLEFSWQETLETLKINSAEYPIEWEECFQGRKLLPSLTTNPSILFFRHSYPVSLNPKPLFFMHRSTLNQVQEKQRELLCSYTRWQSSHSNTQIPWLPSSTQTPFIAPLLLRQVTSSLALHKSPSLLPLSSARTLRPRVFKLLIVLLYHISIFLSTLLPLFECPVKLVH